MPGTPSKTVSVIIPTYNRAWSLRETVDSVLAQDYPDFDLFVVDDGSTDDTQALLAAYGDRITIVRQSNQGVSAARNRGIDASSGELIAFLDSDDRWLPEKLSRQVDWFTHHPDALICQTEEIWIRNGRRVNPKNRHKKPAGNIFEKSLHLCLVSPSAVMIKRRLFDGVGNFDENMPACEDYDLWLRIACRYPVYLIDTPLIIKQGGHPDQLSKLPVLDKYRIYSLTNLIDRGCLSPDQRNAAIGVLKEKCRIYATGCIKRHRIEEAQRYEHIAGQYS